MVSRKPLTSKRDTSTRSDDERAWTLFGTLLAFISADIGMHKAKEKPKFAPHVVRSLLVLAHQPEFITLSTLAQSLGVSLPRASRICDDLVAEGFLSRQRSEVDRRELRLKLTRKAERFNADLWQVRKTPLTAAMSDFSAGEIATVKKFLETLARNYIETATGEGSESL